MDLPEERIGDAVVLDARGRIDSTTAKEFGDRMIGLIESGCRHLVVDFKNLVYISSAGFRALLLAAKKADETQSEFVLCGISGKIRQLFEIGGFTDLFRIYPSREDGLSALR